MTNSLLNMSEFRNSQKRDSQNNYIRVKINVERIVTILAMACLYYHKDIILWIELLKSSLL